MGQEHVTDPLSTALDTGRISHAYLFSGPRGCGKTSSARILARSLNCVEGPTSKPCGVCPSCVALGPGGPGNLDVTELDAASHGGVDDTRELRDRAFYAPAESRYRVFIVDEAHMVTTAGFNALLKIVEEPPAHLIFIFATTEPDKVLPTIRSRTHHYPFRLLPPATMHGLLGRICDQENVPVEEAVYPLVIRAGGGSPRDSLSVLDQLLAGAGPEGVTYTRAVSLLGVTDVALIDDAVEALAVDDGAALFGTVDRVMDAGHDPRRFAVDLLERFRDLILMRAVPDATDRGLVSGPGDVIARMNDQAQRIGPATLTRYAELLHEGLGEMRGATAPRLLLEIVCARMLLPSVADTESATLQRLERLERGIATGAVAVTAPAVTGPAVDAPAASDSRPVPAEPGRRRGAEALAAVRESRVREGSEPLADVSGGTGSARSDASERGGGGTKEGHAAANDLAADQPDARGAERDAVGETADRRGEQGVSHSVGPGVGVADSPETPGPPSLPATSETPPEVSAQPGAAARPAAAGGGVPAPDAESVAGRSPDSVAGSDAELLRAVEAAWGDIRTKVREFGTTVHALLSGASVSRIEDDVIVFAHQHAPLAKRLSDVRNLEAVRAAVRAVLGRDHDVRWEAAGAAARPATAPQAGGRARGATAPQQAATGRGAAQPNGRSSESTAPPRFSRPSQANKAANPQGGAQRSGSEPRPFVADDDIPPPDFPDLPDDPGPGDYPPPDAGYDAPRGAGSGEVPQALTPEEEQEMLDAAAVPVAPEDRRDPDEVALELLRSELGATRLDG